MQIKSFDKLKGQAATGDLCKSLPKLCQCKAAKGAKNLFYRMVQTGMWPYFLLRMLYTIFGAIEIQRFSGLSHTGTSDKIM